jgi:hypothetical protein
MILNPVYGAMRNRYSIGRYALDLLGQHHPSAPPQTHKRKPQSKVHGACFDQFVFISHS